MVHIDPTREQFDTFKSLPRDTPILMLNLIRLKETVEYPDGEVVSGAEAYRRYGEHSGPINLGNPDEFTIRQLARLVRTQINPELQLVEKPLPQDDPQQRKPSIELLIILCFRSDTPVKSEQSRGKKLERSVFTQQFQCSLIVFFHEQLSGIC